MKMKTCTIDFDMKKDITPEDLEAVLKPMKSSEREWIKALSNASIGGFYGVCAAEMLSGVIAMACHDGRLMGIQELNSAVTERKMAAEILWHIASDLSKNLIEEYIGVVTLETMPSEKQIQKQIDLVTYKLAELFNDITHSDSSDIDVECHVIH